MLANGLHIRPFDPQQTSQAEFAALYALDTALQNEGHPEVQPYPYEAFVQGQRRVWRRRKNWQWIAWQGSTAAGWARLDVSTTEVNAHSGGFWLGVRTDLRRRGLGRELLRLVADTALNNSQTEIGAWTSSQVP